MALGVRIAATKRMRPPRLGHSKTSSSRPRRMSSAQVRLHGGATLSGALGAFWLRPPWAGCATPTGRRFGALRATSCQRQVNERKGLAAIHRTTF
jgi:hypothetical protein